MRCSASFFSEKNSNASRWKSQGKRISHNQNSTFWVPLPPSHLFFLVIVAWFSHSSQHSAFGHCVQFLPFLRAYDQLICASNDLSTRGKSETSSTSRCFWSTTEVQWSTAEVSWSTSEVPWSTTGVQVKYDWSTSEVPWSTSEVWLKYKWSIMKYHEVQVKYHVVKLVSISGVMILPETTIL